MFDSVILSGFVVFVMACIGDIFWALYIKNVADGKRLASSNYGAAIGLCYLVSFAILIDSIWYGVFHLCGLWVGTYYNREIERFFKSIINPRK